MQDFTYQGWTFRVNSNGSLDIMPEGTQQGAQGSFPSSKGVNSVTIPKEQLHRLVAYSLTGETDNTVLIDRISSLSNEYQKVTT